MKLAINIRKTALACAALATLATGVAATEASAAGYYVSKPAKTANFPHWDRLNLRAWPAAHSQKVGQVKRFKTVFVQRCIIKSGSDWCKIQKSGGTTGWVNGSFLRLWGQTFSTPHPVAYGWH